MKQIMKQRDDRRLTEEGALFIHWMWTPALVSKNNVLGSEITRKGV